MQKHLKGTTFNYNRSKEPVYLQIYELSFSIYHGKIEKKGKFQRYTTFSNPSQT